MKQWTLITITTTLIIVVTNCHNSTTKIEKKEVISPEMRLFTQCQDLCVDKFGPGLIGFMDQSGIFCLCQEGTLYGDVNTYEFFWEQYNEREGQPNPL